MQLTTNLLARLGLPFEKHVISAHRMPQQLFEFGKQAKSHGFSVIIAGAGGAAHLPGMLAATTILPVIGVPIQSKALNGIDSLLSIVQMPSGIPVATTAIGAAGAKNAALLAAQILALSDDKIANQLVEFRRQQTKEAVESEQQL
ncbi:phosphoribosylaminoimidazole carboxylase catalytic subunit [Paucilactobacillus hokkaidonensis]|nr:phosphoribosylaminoimidazole carboxylase catalytic subunit [Paucilactobacillus hokkaidonensis]